jgi:hypothetical protein
LAHYAHYTPDVIDNLTVQDFLGVLDAIDHLLAEMKKQ